MRSCVRFLDLRLAIPAWVLVQALCVLFLPAYMEFFPDLPLVITPRRILLTVLNVGTGAWVFLSWVNRYSSERVIGPNAFETKGV